MISASATLRLTCIDIWPIGWLMGAAHPAVAGRPGYAFGSAVICGSAPHMGLYYTVVRFRSLRTKVLYTSTSAPVELCSWRITTGRICCMHSITLAAAPMVFDYYKCDTKLLPIGKLVPIVLDGCHQNQGMCLEASDSVAGRWDANLLVLRHGASGLLFRPRPPQRLAFLEQLRSSGIIVLIVCQPSCRSEPALLRGQAGPVGCS